MPNDTLTSSEGSSWPVHPVPLEDETVVSWMHRLSRANGTTFHGLTSATWRGKKVGSLILDRLAPEWVLMGLHQRAAQPLERVRAMTLASLEGKLFCGDMSGRIRWVLPESSGGQQFCPDCLMEDAIPHFRLSWRLAFVTRCPKHKRTLLDACPACHKAVDLSKVTKGESDPSLDLPLTACSHCGFDLRTPGSVQPQEVPMPKSLDRLGAALQARMMQGLSDGWMEVEGHGFIYSHLVFDGIHQIAKLLGGKRSAQKLASVIGRRLRLKPEDLPIEAWPKGHSFEFLHSGQRRRMLGLVAWLLEEWPTRFVKVCREAKVWSNHIQQDRMGQTPYWLNKVANEELKSVNAQWRPAGSKGQKRAVDSYNRLAKRVLSHRLADRARKILFIREHQHLVGDLRALASAMRESGLYSLGNQIHSIIPFLPKLIEAANDPTSLEQVHGIPLAMDFTARPFTQNRARAYMTIKEEKEFMKSFFEKERKGIPITAKAVRAALILHLNKNVTESAVYRWLRRQGWNPRAGRFAQWLIAHSKHVWAFTGVVYWGRTTEIHKISPSKRIWVPPAFWKTVIWAYAGGELKTCSWMIPHQANIPKKPCMEYMVSVQDVFRKAGVNVLGTRTEALFTQVDA